jgi:hypothetical protein
LEKKEKQILPGSEGVRVRKGVSGRGEKSPNQVCTHEYMNKENVVFYTMEFYSAIKKNENLSFAGK